MPFHQHCSDQAKDASKSQTDQIVPKRGTDAIHHNVAKIRHNMQHRVPLIDLKNGIRKYLYRINNGVKYISAVTSTP